MPDLIRNIDKQVVTYGSLISYRSLPSYHMPMHHHNEVQILVPLEGSHYEITWLTENRERESKHLSVADICLIPPLLEHEVRWTNSANFINLKITPGFIREHTSEGFNAEEKLFKALIGYEDPFLFQLGRSLRAYFLRSRQDNYKYYHSILCIVAQHILDTCLQPEDSAELVSDLAQLPCEKIRDAVLIISNNLDRNLRIEEIAGQVGMSPYHFMRQFKKAIGMPASRFHTVQRIEKAKEMLLKDERIIDVAASLGFSSQAHFGNVFAKLVGMTPGKFAMQRQHRA